MYYFKDVFPYFLAILGTFIGSFSNVVIYRIKHGGSIFWGRSKCPKCNHILSSTDLIPIISWICLIGKCQYCKKPISLQYIIIEVSFMILWFIVGYKLGFPEGGNEWTYFLMILYIISSLIIITAYDLLYMEIPDEVSLPAIALVVFSLYLPQTPKLSSALLGCLIIYTFFYSQIFIPSIIHVKKGKRFEKLKCLIETYILFPLWITLSLFLPKKVLEKISLFQESESEKDDEQIAWIGGGDLRLAFLMGFLLGVKGAIIALFIGYIIGAIIGIIGMALLGLKRKSMIPFGPFLSIGIFISLFWSDELWIWYWNILQ